LHGELTNPPSEVVTDVYGGLASSDVAKPPVVMLVTEEQIPVEQGFRSKNISPTFPSHST
jgi:hypothetical protein